MMIESLSTYINEFLPWVNKLWGWLGAIVAIAGVISFYIKLFPKAKNKFINLFKTKDKPNTKTIKLKLLRKVNTFLDNGDISSAKTVLKEGSEFKHLHPNRMLEIIVIEQKYGQVELGLKHIELATTLISPDPLSSLFVQLQLVKFKLESQKGNLSYIYANASKLEALLQEIGENQKTPSVINRLGVYYSVNKNIDEARKCYEKSLKISKNYKQKHTEITTRMFMVISQSLCGVELGIKKPLEEIIKIQDDYRSASLSEDNLDLWQVHLLKSIVQTLFCESAILYTKGHQSRAFLRLCAANLLVVPAKACPTAEGYADLLNLVRNSKLKEYLISAMGRTDMQREKFLNSIGASSIFLTQLQQLVKPNYTILEKSIWEKFRDFIKQQDKNEPDN